MKWKTTYKIFVFSFILSPNIFVAILGLESFPYTCAPMFGHYIDENTSLYILKFEGVDNGRVVNLLEYYDKAEVRFIRHFFGKVYGSTEPRSPYSSRLTDGKKEFETRMNNFFQNFSMFLSVKHNMHFDKINIQVMKVDQNRNKLSEFSLLGYYDLIQEKYYSSYEAPTESN